MVQASQLIAKVSAQGAEETTQKMRGVGTSVDEAGSSIREFAMGAAVIGAAALLGIGVASVKMAGDFQSEMTSLVTGAGEAESNLKMVSDGILNMAPSVGTTTKQLADGMYLIESAGQHGAQALETLKNAAMGAKVGNADLATVANGVTTIMTDYASSNISSAQAVNTLIATVASGKTHMADLSNALSSILPTASAAGVSLTDVSAAMATMTGEGTPAADASTYLRQTIMSLINPASASASALESIGLTTKEVSEGIKTSLPDTLKLITDHLKQKFPEGSAAYVKALSDIAGGSKQMQGILELTGSHLDVFKSNVAGITDAVTKGGDGIAGWSKVQGDFNFKIDQAKAFIESLGIKIGTFLLPVVGAVVGGFVSGMQNIMSAVGSAFTYIGNVLKTINYSNFLEAWKNIQGLLQDIQGRIEKGLAPAFRVLKTDADPVAEVIGNLAKGGLSILSSILWSVESALLEVDKEMAIGKGGMIDFGNSLKQWEPPLRNIASLLIGQFKDGLKFAGEEARQIGGWFKTSLVPALKDVEPGFNSLAHTILDTTAAMLKIRGIFTEVVEHGIKRFLPEIEKIIPPLIRFEGLLAGGVSAALKFIAPYAVQAAQAIGKFAMEIQDRVAPILDKWINTAIGGLNLFESIWMAVWPTLAPILKGVWDMLTGIIQIAWSLVSGIIKIGLDVLGGNWGQAWQDMKDMFGGIWQGVVTATQGYLETIKAIFSPIGQWFHDRWQSVVDGFHNVIGGIGNIAHNIFNTVTGAIKTGFNNIIDLVNGVIGHINSINVGGVGVHIDLIPHLASGTDFFGGGLAVMGEQGPELAHLPRGSRVIPAAQTAQMLSGGGSKQPVYIIFQVGSQQIAQAFLPDLVSQIRHVTGNWSI